ncbi:MAG: transglycosylase domain-containing protein [Acidithiobacillaceae bacterium]|nr:transglycosylase domain-containing protein [Acidithiobacillaceae bacterium]MBU2747994.1 penicillin-binding protein [Acidithiobacillus montserratensis]
MRSRIIAQILHWSRLCLWPRGRYAWWRRSGQWLLLSIILVAVSAWFMPPDTGVLKQEGRIIYDRHGHVLSLFLNHQQQWAFATSPQQVSPVMRQMLIAIEDRNFAWDPGIDPFAIIRAVGQMIVAGHVVSGASTLTMQVTRMLHPAPRTLPVKIVEALQAISLYEHYSKTAVLGMWLSLAPEGGNLQGIEAAAHAWFNQSPRTLGPAQAAFLVMLVRNPNQLNPLIHPRAALATRNQILREARRQGIISRAALERALATPLPHRLYPMPLLSPQAVSTLPSGTHSTLDASMDRPIARIAHHALQKMAPSESMAIMVVSLKTKGIRAIYSGDWGNLQRDGFMDMTRAIRSPGSALKPFLYGLGFEAGLIRPSTNVADFPSNFGAYEPNDYNDQYMGVVTATTALRRSLNVPAVDLMAAYGPLRFAAHLRAAGAPLLLPYGANPALPLALGGAGISMRRLLALYAGLADGGVVERLHLIAGQHRPARRLLSPYAAEEVTAILHRPFPFGGPGGIAWKTGTSAGNRDDWAIGYNHRYAAAVWIGQPNGAALPGDTALAAIPILAQVFSILPGQPITIHPETHPLTLQRQPMGTVLEIASPPPGGTLTIGEPVSIRIIGGNRPFHFLLDGRPLPSNPALRSIDWTPSVAGFYHLSVLDADGQLVKRVLHAVAPIHAANLEWN